MTKEWPTKKIKEFCEFKYGKNLPADKRVDGPYPVYGSSSIASYHEDYLIQAPGLIVGRKGTVGKVQLSKENYFPIDTTFYVDNTCTKENIYFLFYFFQLCGFEEMNSDAAVPGLNRNAAINLKVKLPPRVAQNKIAAVLTSYDDLIENNLKRIKLLEEMAQITYQEWFVRMKFPGHETAAFDEETGFPLGWKTEKIGSIYKTSSGGTPSTKNSEYYESGTIKWVRTQELKGSLILDTSAYITEQGLKNSSAKVFPANTVLLAMYGNTIGETGYLTTEASTNQACCAFLTSRNHSYFLHQYLMLYKPKILNYRMGAAQENISQSIIQNIEILSPSEDMVDRYGAFAKDLYLNIENIMKQNILLKEARDILLPRLMTGMINIEQVELPEAMLKRLEAQEDKMATTV